MKSLIFLSLCISISYAVPVENSDIQSLLQEELLKGIWDSILSILPSGQDLLNIITHPTTISLVTTLAPIVLGKRAIELNFPQIIMEILEKVKNFIEGIMTVIAWIIYGPLGK